MSGILLAFSSTHDGVTVRSALRDRYHFYVLPTPREITESCGISVLLDTSDWSSIQNELKGLGLDSTLVHGYLTASDSGKSTYVEQVWD